jgi:hypothetical protein
MLGDDGNLMQADGNSFPVFILGWTIGGSAGVPPAGSGVAPEPSLDKLVCWTGFRRDAENGNRDGRAPRTNSAGATGRGALARGWAMTEI